MCLYDIWGVDLVDIKSLAKSNKNYKYILMIIDVFSKYGWAIPIMFKSAAIVENALETIFKTVTPKRNWAQNFITRK